MGYLVLKDVIVSIHHFPPTTGKLQRHSPRAIFTRAVFMRRHEGLDETGKLYQAWGTPETESVMEAKSLETLQTEHRHGFIAQHPLLFLSSCRRWFNHQKRATKTLFRMSLSMSFSQMVILKEKHQQWQKWWKRLKVWLIGRCLWRVLCRHMLHFFHNWQQALKFHRSWGNYAVVIKWCDGVVQAAWRCTCVHLHARHEIGVDVNVYAHMKKDQIWNRYAWSSLCRIFLLKRIMW